MRAEFGRDACEADDVAEVDGYHVVILGWYCLVPLQALGHGGRQHLVQKVFGALLLSFQLLRLSVQARGDALHLHCHHVDEVHGARGAEEDEGEHRRVDGHLSLGPGVRRAEVFVEVVSELVHDVCQVVDIQRHVIEPALTQDLSVIDRLFAADDGVAVVLETFVEQRNVLLQLYLQRLHVALFALRVVLKGELYVELELDFQL